MSYARYREFADCDYKSKLSPADRKWLNQFLREYYRAMGLGNADVIHPKVHHRGLYTDMYNYKVDVVNTPPKPRKPSPKVTQLRFGTYTENDYPFDQVHDICHEVRDCPEIGYPGHVRYKYRE